MHSHTDELSQRGESHHGEGHKHHDEDGPEPDHMWWGGVREHALSPLDAEQSFSLDHGKAHPTLGSKALALAINKVAISLPYSDESSCKVKKQAVAVQGLGGREPEDILEVECV